jgi:hypothetical protein
MLSVPEYLSKKTFFGRKLTRVNPLRTVMFTRISSFDWFRNNILQDSEKSSLEGQAMAGPINICL